MTLYLVKHTNPVSEKLAHHLTYGMHSLMLIQKLEFAHCDAHYQYVLLTYTDVLLMSLQHYEY